MNLSSGLPIVNLGLNCFQSIGSCIIGCVFVHLAQAAEKGPEHQVILPQGFAREGCQAAISSPLMAFLFLISYQC